MEDIDIKDVKECGFIGIRKLVLTNAWKRLKALGRDFSNEEFKKIIREEWQRAKKKCE